MTWRASEKKKKYHLEVEPKHVTYKLNKNKIIRCC